MSGLSQMTLNPASIAAFAISWCVWFGVATEMKSTRSVGGSLSSPSMSSL